MEDAARLIDEAPDDVAPKKAKGRKNGQIVDGAIKVFMKNGFEGASVDEIAKTACVSKATLYCYYPDKVALFEGAVEQICAQMGDMVGKLDDHKAPVREVLYNTAKTFIGFMATPFALNVFRVCISEAGRFPELGQAFFRAGPMEVRDSMIGYFEDAAADGRLNIDDVEMAAGLFSALCKADLFPRLMGGCTADVTEDRIERAAREAVETFVARFGTPLTD